jgi:hypothetical protein
MIRAWPQYVNQLTLRHDLLVWHEMQTDVVWCIYKLRQLLQETFERPICKGHRRSRETAYRLCIEFELTHYG